MSEAPDHGLQVFDLERLRHMTSFEYVDPDTTYKLFGKAHNIVGHEETGYVYVVGANDKKYPYGCEGRDISKQLINMHALTFLKTRCTQRAQTIATLSVRVRNWYAKRVITQPMTIDIDLRQ